MTNADILSEGLRRAVAAVEEANVPDDLREIAFGRGLDFLLGGQHGVAAGMGRDAAAVPVQNNGTEPNHDGANPAGRLASKLGITQAEAEAVFDIDEDGLHLVLSPGKLDGKVTAAMEQIARLVVVGRQAAGLDDGGWTSVEHVRAACEDRGRYSSGNFSTYVKHLDGDGFRLRGSGPKREIKASAVAYEDTGRLVKQLVTQG